jgi:hypothetical protein
MNSAEDDSTPQVPIDWICDKLSDDLDNALVDPEIVNSSFAQLRRSLPIEKQKHLKRKIAPYPRSLVIPVLKNTCPLRLAIKQRKFSVCVEVTQIGALLALWRSEDILRELQTANMEFYDFSTGNDLVFNVSARDKATLPQFIVATCAPCCFNHRFSQIYNLVHPLYLEKQFVLQKTKAQFERSPRRMIVFQNSTAQIEWRWIEKYRKLPQELLPFRSYAEFPVYKFQMLFEQIRRMQRDDAIILWKPTIFPLLAQEEVLQKVFSQSEAIFYSPIGLYCRKDVDENLRREFIQLFFAVWNSLENEWSTDRAEVIKYLKGRLQLALGKAVISEFSLATWGAGNPDARSPQRAVHNPDFTMVSWFGTTYTFARGLQADVVRVLWDEWGRTGLGLHQETIHERVDENRESFKMTNIFRNHYAFGKMIQKLGDGLYSLCPPGVGAPVKHQRRSR